MNRLVVGYRHWGGETRCRFCGGDYMAIEDDGEMASYLVRCWCGATARVRRNDPDLVQALLP
jgi:hypothetical protein